MKLKTLLVTIGAVFACATPSVPRQSGSEPQAQESEQQSRSLFDGLTLDGWDGDPRYWSVRDGVIVGESTPEQPCDKTNYMIWTGGGDVADFELRFQFRISSGNSGVQFRSNLLGQWDVEGYQADFEYGPNWTGCLYETNGRGVVARRGQRVTFNGNGSKTLERFGTDRELLDKVRPDDWNGYLLRAVGNRIEIEINGFRMSEVIDGDSRLARSKGLLALQMHAGPPMKVEYRDLELKLLGGGEASTADGSSSVQVPPMQVPNGPEWIWLRWDAQDGEEAWFHRSFEIAEDGVQASLSGTADNKLNVYLNGRNVAAANDWTNPFEVDVSEALQRGSNSLAVWCQNEYGPAGLWLELSFVHADGREERILTDGSWSVSGEQVEGWRAFGFEPEGWPAAHSFGPLGVPPWGLLMQMEGVPRTPSAALAAEEIELPEGFRAELVYSVPAATQGSWVSLAVDEYGRLIASDQYGGLYRVTPAPIGVDRLTVIEPLGVELGEAQGLEYAFGSLYAVVSGAGAYTSGLYRLRDTDRDDRFDELLCLKTFDGSGEHGPHAVIADREQGQLWIVGGNHTRLPADIDLSRVPMVWGEDQLLPRIDDPNHHAVGVMAPGGWVCRTDPEGERWELYAAGLRNTYDAAFDAEGELFTFDADMEWDVGLPWYRPTRICHLVSGAEFGWRHGSGKWPEYYPDNLPAALDLGRTSPTGVLFGTKTNFPEPYDRALYAADWAFGRIYAVHLTESGASYTGRAETFVKGEPLPVTDMVVSPDGALYFTTGGRRTQSGLYRVIWTGPEGAAAGDAPARAPDSEAERARALRRRLESLHGSQDARTLETAWPHLDNPDRFLRFAARTAVEHQDPALWLQRAFSEDRPRALVEVLLAVVRTAPGRAPDVIGRLLELEFRELEEETQLAVLRVIGLALIRGETAAKGARERLTLWLEDLLPYGRDHLDRELCRLLVRCGSTAVIAEALLLMEGADTQEAQIHYAHMLSQVAAGWSLDQRRAYFAWFAQTLPYLEGGISLQKYLDVIRQQALDTLTREERAALPQVEQSPQDESAQPLPALTQVRKWTLEELLPGLGRVDEGRDLDRGKQAFRNAACLDCHRIGGAGGSTGPDLAGAAGRFSARDLLQELLAPSRTISDQYQDTEILTHDERFYVGRLVADGPQGVTLITIPPEEDTVEIPAGEIAVRRLHPLSRMPDGLLNVLSQDEIYDLIAYVLAESKSD